MTEPLTPNDCDCRGLPFMPLEVSRLIDSDFTALSTGDEFKAGLILWAKSWGQVPAASIPDDDRILAHWVGRSLKEWGEIKEMALRGWVRCDDGRLYHPVIADLALNAAKKRRGQAERASSRWAKVRAEKAAAAVLRQKITDAVASKDDAVAMQGTVKEEGNTPPISPPLGAGRLDEECEPEGELVREAFDLWNEMAGRLGLPRAKTLDEGRRRAIRKRLASGGLEEWRNALTAVERSRHCRGENDRGWKADLDFVCQPKSWRRLLEGTYGQDAPPSPGRPGMSARVAAWSPEIWSTAVRIFVAEGQWDETVVGPRPGEPGCFAPPEILRRHGIEPATPVAIPGAAA